MSITDIHQKHFTSRLNIADAYTESLMNFLKEKKHIKEYKKATKEEDMNGVDWWILYEDSAKPIPIQFKLRDKQKDIPVCRYQPFYGLENDRTVEGRDWRCLQSSASKEYFVAVRNGDGKFVEIYKISCRKLKSAVKQLNEDWMAVSGVFDTFSPTFFDDKHVKMWLERGIWNKRVFRNEKGGEVWWKKNKNENFPKFNMYVPYSTMDWNILISKEESLKIDERVK